MGKIIFSIAAMLSAKFRLTHYDEKVKISNISGSVGEDEFGWMWVRSLPGCTRSMGPRPSSSVRVPLQSARQHGIRHKQPTALCGKLWLKLTTKNSKVVRIRG